MPVRILYLASSSNMWGARKSLADLLCSLDRRKFQPFVVLPEEGPLSWFLEERKIPFYILPLPSWRKFKKWRRIPSTLFRLWKVIQREKVHLIHANSHFVAPYGIVCGKLTKTPVITHVRSLLTPDKIGKYLLRWSDMIICNSYATAEVFPSPMLKKVKVIYNGIDTDYFSPQREEKIREWKERWGLGTEPVVGYIGKISREKGVDLLIDILPEVLKRVPKAKFMVAGKVRREKDEDLLQRLEKFGNHVVLTGWLEDLPLFYSSIDVLLFPTRKESFGRVVAEALSCETPVVATKTGGVTEILEDGVTGYLVEEGKREDMVRKISHILLNPNLAKKMGKEGRKSVNLRFALSQQIGKVEAIYNALLNRL